MGEGLNLGSISVWQNPGANCLALDLEMVQEIQALSEKQIFSFAITAWETSSIMPFSIWVICGREQLVLWGFFSTVLCRVLKKKIACPISLKDLKVTSRLYLSVGEIQTCVTVYVILALNLNCLAHQIVFHGFLYPGNVRYHLTAWGMQWCGLLEVVK